MANFNRLPVLFLVTSLLVMGCSGSNQGNVTVSSVNKGSSLASGDHTLEEARTYKELAEKNEPPKSYEYRLQAADLFIAIDYNEEAKQLLQQLPNDIDPKFQEERNVLLAELSLKARKPHDTIAHLRDITDSNLLSSHYQEKIFGLKAGAYEQLGEPVKSSEARAYLDEMLFNAQDKHTNEDLLWSNLARADVSDLQQYAASHETTPLSGWVKLALILRTESVGNLSYALDDWRYQFPGHPGHAYIKSQSESPAAFDKAYPAQIALLLPLSGTHQKAAEAIRDGFLTKYYGDNASANKPRVQVYDTTSTNDIQGLYMQAVNEGADFVIGPLMKEKVLELSRLSAYQMKAPVLALNFNPQIRRAPDNFYQFALDPEDEVQQLAERIWQKNYRHPAIIVPKNTWGQRIEKAFNEKWESMGGKSAQSVAISDKGDSAKAIRDLLLVDESMERSKIIKNAIREKVDYQIRRRQDLDLVVLAAPPEQARQIKPLLNFYFAHDLPVYATSSVYIGQPTPSKDQDVNGVIFCDMPWLLMTDQKSYATKALITKHWPEEANMYARLFAMGVDAYELTSEIPMLQAEPYREYQGATGMLSLTPDHRINRRLVWAQFSRGAPKVID